MGIRRLLLCLLLNGVGPARAADDSATLPEAFVLVSAGGDQGARCEALMRELDDKPDPRSGPWHFVSQAFGAYGGHEVKLHVFHQDHLFIF